jgi:hypothetical protein
VINPGPFYRVSHHVIVIQLTRAWLRKAPFRHDQAPIELPHGSEETIHALRLVYRLVGFSWMRRGDASANHHHLRHPGAHGYIRCTCAFGGLSDCHLRRAARDCVPDAVLGPYPLAVTLGTKCGETRMRACLLLVTPLTLAGCARTGATAETPPANRTDAMPTPGEPKTLLHVP